MRQRRRWTLIGAAVTMIIATARSAYADQAADAAKAQALFSEGVHAEENGDCARAIEKFDGAIALVETPQLRLRSARCKEKVGKLVEALGDYQRATAIAKGDPELLAAAKGQLSNVMPRVPRIDFDFAKGAPAGVEVTVDGEKVADLESGQLVNPGEHRIGATAPKYRRFEVDVTVREAKTLAVVMVLDPIVFPPLPKAEPKGVDPVPWILIGSSGATLGAAIGLGVYSVILADDTQEELPDSTCRTVSQFRAECDGEVSSVERDKIEQNVVLSLSIGSAIVSAGLLTTGIIMLTQGSDEDTPVMGRVTPWFGPTSGGITFGGTF
ncbi:MAG: hypothetical protein HOW73_14565 [Polyangiaceae bacterium]|nr:hypothetical protein [Polyangiaceae bacterium]